MQTVLKFQNFAILLDFIDSIVVFSKNKTLAEKIIEKLKQHLYLKILGKTLKLVGVLLGHQNQSVLILQNLYIDEICDKFSNFHIPSSTIRITKGH